MKQEYEFNEINLARCLYNKTTIKEKFSILKSTMKNKTFSEIKFSEIKGFEFGLFL